MITGSIDRIHEPPLKLSGLAPSRKRLDGFKLLIFLRLGAPSKQPASIETIKARRTVW